MARRIWIVCLSLALAATSLPAGAQEGLLEDLYGRGVHAYFERRYEEAHGLLTKAITSGLKDPRAYYFRGLTYLRLGRPEEATAEFTTGAELEAIAAEPVNVGKAIERIQGAERLAIEQQRRAARVRLFDKAEAAAKARYEEREDAEKRVLLPRTRKPGTGAASAAAGADETNPFAEGAARPALLPATPADAKPTTPPPPAPAPDAPAKPAEPKPAEPKPAEPAKSAEAPRGSVFGALFRAVKNSVPSDAAAAPDAVVPAGNPSAPIPVGSTPAAPIQPGAKPAPKAPASDPFADPAAKPATAKPAANNDPFAK